MLLFQHDLSCARGHFQERAWRKARRRAKEVQETTRTPSNWRPIARGDSPSRKGCPAMGTPVGDGHSANPSTKFRPCFWCFLMFMMFIWYPLLPGAPHSQMRFTKVQYARFMCRTSKQGLARRGTTDPAISESGSAHTAPTVTKTVALARWGPHLSLLCFLLFALLYSVLSLLFGFVFWIAVVPTSCVKCCRTAALCFAVPCFFCVSGLAVDLFACLPSKFV